MLVKMIVSLVNTDVLIMIFYRLPNIKKLVVTGGHLDETNSKELQNMKSGHLTIYGLYGDGYVIIFVLSQT